MISECKVKNPVMAILHTDAKSLASLIQKVSYQNVRRLEEFIPQADTLFNTDTDCQGRS